MFFINIKNLLVNADASDNWNGFSEWEKTGMKSLREANVVSCQTPAHQSLIQEVSDIQDPWKR